LLRPEFDDATARVRDRGLRRLLVFFGGSDPSRESLKLVAALRSLGKSMLRTRLVLGPMNVCADEVRREARDLTSVSVIGATSRMSKLMQEADLGVGTCGGAAWERCVVGLPGLVVVTADNQRDDARLLDVAGAVRNLGDSVGVSAEVWAAELRRLVDRPELLRQMSQASCAVMSGHKEALEELEKALIG
jgi:UDP-2,4-diacetamido-2,4,6-trideoxy-beta-L-altropyranose hydrolase